MTGLKLTIYADAEAADVDADHGANGEEGQGPNDRVKGRACKDARGGRTEGRSAPGAEKTLTTSDITTLGQFCSTIRIVNAASPEPKLNDFMQLTDRRIWP